MKKIIYTYALLLGIILSSNAQIESLAGPRVDGVFVMPGISADMINTKFDVDIYEPEEWEERTKEFTTGSRISITLSFNLGR